MKKSVLTFVVAGALLGAAPIASFAKPHTPAQGSSERTAIMKAMHKVLGGGKHKPLVTARAFHVEKGWAYLTGGFEYADGAPLEERFSEGSGTNFTALLHFEGKGKSAGWKVKRRVYNGDVVVDQFKKDFPAAPRAIFQDE